MELNKILRVSLLATAIAFSLTGCGDEEQEMSQQEVEYLSQLDQARFFQRQGELKASTREARSAMEMSPGNVAPYLIIVDNLITAGDALNAARQIETISKNLEDVSLDEATRNRIELLRARTDMMRNRPDEALAVLDAVESLDHSQKLKAATLRGEINHRMGNLEAARDAYKAAREIDAEAVLPIIGLSRLAYAEDDVNLASEYISEAEAIDKGDPELWLWKAQFAQGQEKWAEAEAAYIKALEDIGQYDIMTYRKYQTMSALIEVLREQGKSAEAFVYEEILAKSAPGTIKSNYASAQQAYRDGDISEAAHFLEENVNQAPGHTPSALMLGIIRFRQGRVDEAERLLNPLSEQTNSLAASKLLAATQLQLQRPEEAKKLLGNLSENQNDPGVLALVGIATLATGDDKAGRQYIEKALELQPENNTLRLRYARYLSQKQEYDVAIQQAEQVLSADSSSDDARVVIIQAHMQSGNQEAATQSASAWVKEQPDNINALIVHGDLSLATGDSADAKQFYEQALALAEDDPRPDMALARLAQRSDNTDEALARYKAAVKKAPDNRQVLSGFMSAAETDEAETFLKQILSENPNATGPKLVLLEMALNSGESDRADELTAELLEPVDETTTSPNADMVATIYTAVAARKARSNGMDEAEALLDRARTLFANNEDVNLQAAGLQFRKGNEEKARELIKQTRREHPDSARPYLLEARYAFENGRFNEAAELYELALTKEGNAEVARRYAEALQRDGQRQKAVESLEKSSNVYPDSVELKLALGVAYQGIENTEDAINAYKAVLDVDGDNAIALNNLAWMYHIQESDQALPLAEKAYEVSPNSAAVADTYGWILFKMGEQEKSVSVLEQAYQTAPQAREIALHLAEAYKATGRESKAKEVLEKMQ